MAIAQTQPKASRVRFSVFEVNLVSRELFKGGIRLKLQKQPFEILCTLVERPGEVVSREELRERLWPDNTFVVYEDSLNTAVRKLRAALSDSSAMPRYIETLAGQGYRFIAPVVVVEAAPVATGPDIRDQPVAQELTLAALPPIKVPVPDVSSRGGQGLRATLAGIAFLLLAVASTGGFFWHRYRAAHKSNMRAMLAVLPFQNLTGDPAQEYFSDGLTEEMIAQLGNLDPEHVGVVARTSVMQYKNTQKPLDEIGRELGVQYVIEGSVRRDADEVRITAQMIQTGEQTHLWARQYDRELKGLLALQGEIANEIADETRQTLDGKHLAAPSASNLLPRSYKAYDLYLKAQYLFNTRTVPNMQEAIGYFQQAVAEDPGYARAYAGMADAYALMSGYSGHPQSEFMPKAREAALRALQLDPNLAEAHTALALIVENYDWDWETAEKEFRRAIELNPNYATAHHWYAEHLMWRGRFDDGLRESELARQLDPLSLIIAADNGAIFFYSRQNDRAIEKWRSVLQLDPRFPRARMITFAYVQNKEFAQAQEITQRYHTDGPDPWYWATLAYIHGRAGDREAATHAVNELLKLNAREQVDPMVLAGAYAGISDKEHAVSWLQKAYGQHSNELTSLKVDPIYDFLRGDARFQDLLRKIGLAD